MAKMGRPTKKVNWEELDAMCEIQCTGVEIAGVFGISYDALADAVKREKKMTFAEYYEQKSAPGRKSLRRKQWELAMKGDRVMLIWLGKQMLGQSEKEKIQVTGKDEGPQVILTLPSNGREVLDPTSEN